MVSTEEDSKKVWCPMARNAHPGTGAAANTNATCRGSKCKLWEWVDDKDGVRTDSGYCGLSTEVHFIGFTTETASGPRKKNRKKEDAPKS